MDVFAYCAQEFAASTRRAAGIEPLTCPPVTAETVPPIEADFIYLDLHGQFGDPAWYGDDGTVAMTAQQVRSYAIDGAVVFAVNCWLGDDSPMLRALLHAGAHVIAGEGPNYGPPGGKLYGAPLLGLWLRRFLRVGWDITRALPAAKRIAALRGGGEYVVTDVMAFDVYTEDEEIYV